MSRIILLDTNTFSYIVRGNSQAARREFLRRKADSSLRLCLSVITEAEVRYGIAHFALSPQRRSAIEALLAHFEILPWGSGEAAVWAETRAQLESSGLTIATMDLLIAAQAIAAGAVLVTRDRIFREIEALPGLEDWATDL